MTDTVIVLFSRDLRVHDHPALAAACERARHVVPLFVADPAVPSGNRWGFLSQCLADLRESLRERGGELVVRRGDTVAETMRLAGETGADAVYASLDVSTFARLRQRGLTEECERARMEYRLFPGLTVVPPDALRPSGGGDHYRVFTPYWRAWSGRARREVLKAPGTVSVPRSLFAGPLPEPECRTYELFTGGETVGRRRMEQWLRHCVREYTDGHDDMAGNRTSRLSPYLRFGCISPLELESLAGEAGNMWAAGATGPAGIVGLAGDADPAGEADPSGNARAEDTGDTGDAGDPREAAYARAAGEVAAFVRQLCWRDFFYQVTRAFPRMDRDDYRPRGNEWRGDEQAAQAWKEGMTGVPIVDAGMRQMLTEGWMHNRARLITGSFLVRRLGVDWRVGGDHFFEHLLDGDVANNYGNWQWVAGTGNDTRPNRPVNHIRQARRYDPDGEYVRRYVPELHAVPKRMIHEPWRLPVRVPGYPPPLVSMD
ncbi:deoxyribodipyrimidine photo-lyase [Streptosporangium longisporum]|uniref:Deoxyribodipyrimidine photo-lyase n=1 Tax=Streptosporangium longisporum TaxID=46187 RepID=A0ABN3XRZ3_9ACTN